MRKKSKPITDVFRPEALYKSTEFWLGVIVGGGAAFFAVMVILNKS